MVETPAGLGEWYIDRYSETQPARQVMSRKPADETAAAASPRGRLLITGASGYIGRRLVSVARDRGFEVVAGVRAPERWAPMNGVAVRRFDLTVAEEVYDLVAGVDVIVHLAAVIDTKARNLDGEGLDGRAGALRRHPVVQELPPIVGHQLTEKLEIPLGR